MYIRRNKIRILTKELLQRAGVKYPPVPIYDIARSQGAEVQITNDPVTNISGFLLLGDQKPIVGINGRQAPNRQRFTAAHELGHLLLHNDASQNVYVDHASFRVLLRDGQSSTGMDEKEREANLFAAEILMPASFLKEDLKDKTQFDIEDENFWQVLAKRYRVSREAMMIRLSTLGYINV